jgi:hypothetical protein
VTPLERAMDQAVREVRYALNMTLVTDGTVADDDIRYTSEDVNALLRPYLQEVGRVAAQEAVRKATADLGAALEALVVDGWGAPWLGSRCPKAYRHAARIVREYGEGADT